MVYGSMLFILLFLNNLSRKINEKKMKFRGSRLCDSFLLTLNRGASRNLQNPRWAYCTYTCTHVSIFSNVYSHNIIAVIKISVSTLWNNVPSHEKSSIHLKLSIYVLYSSISEWVIWCFPLITMPYVDKSASRKKSE